LPDPAVLSKVVSGNWQSSQGDCGCGAVPPNVRIAGFVMAPAGLGAGLAPCVIDIAGVPAAAAIGLPVRMA